MPALAEELQKSHDDDGAAQGQGLQPLRLERRLHSRTTRPTATRKTVLKFNVTIPVEASSARSASSKPSKARYIPEDDTTMPLHGGWLLRGVRLDPADRRSRAEEGGFSSSSPTAKGFPPPLGDISDLGGEIPISSARP